MAKKSYKSRRSQIPSSSWLVWILAFLFVLFVWDLGRFTGVLEQTAQSEDTETLPNVDLIAVLTGGQGRLKEAFRLLEMGRGRRLLISGTNASLEDILVVNNVENITPELLEKVILDPDSRRTIDNARIVKKIARDVEAKSVLVVTSTYHMQRSLRMIEKEFAREPSFRSQLHTFPVSTPNFDVDNWYKSLTGWRLILSEYFKSLGTRF